MKVAIIPKSAGPYIAYRRSLFNKLRSIADAIGNTFFVVDGASTIGTSNPSAPAPFEPARSQHGAWDAVDRYLDEVQSAIASIDRSSVRNVVDALEAVWARGGTTFLIGNGGSASTASHMMNDLTKFTALPGKQRFRALALTDNVPLMSAVANDLDYADVFVEPLRSFARPGDALIAISGSGNSPNVVRAIEYALRYGIVTIGLCGSPGGRLAAIADHRVIVPADRIGQQEDGHLVLNHAIATALRERIERFSVDAARSTLAT